MLRMLMETTMFKLYIRFVPTSCFFIFNFLFYVVRMLCLCSGYVTTCLGFGNDYYMTYVALLPQKWLQIDQTSC